MSGVVRWGIIGAGQIADVVMAPAMLASPHADLVAVCKRDRQAAQAFADRHGARRAYDDYRAVLADPDVDAVYVATTPQRHLEEVLAAAAAGKHVLCEKPLAMTVEEAERMRGVCAGAGVQLMVCFYQRFSARNQKIKELLEQGAIGRVVEARWSSSSRQSQRVEAWRQDPAQSGGGPLMDVGVHCIDLMRYLLGEPGQVVAMTDTLAGTYPVEDTSTVMFRLAGGAHAVISTHWSALDPNQTRSSRLEIMGTEGSIISTPLQDKFSRGTLTVVTRDGEEVLQFDRSTHEVVLAEFAAALEEGRPPSVNGDDGVAAQRILEAAYRSSATGALVRLGTG
ncbi:MAG: Gfo/Idh/MocA family oxidoreductase [Chloroflexota bacterium]